MIDSEILDLLSKNAIEEIPLSTPIKGWMSNMFLVPKKNGGWRPILNLKRLNANYLSAPHFRMDTVSDVRLLIQKDDWAVSIDLKDAYQHISIVPRFRKYLRFGWKGKLYQFLVLPFGLSTAPLVFTKLTRPLAAFLRSQGIRCVFYLDDILILGLTLEECLRFRDIALRLLRSAGLLINLKKSSLTPSQNFEFLGFLWSTSSGLLGLPPLKLDRIQRLSSAILSRTLTSCKALHELLGHIAAAFIAVPLLRLHSRFLQRDLYRKYSSTADLNRRLSLSRDSIQDLHWILSLQAQDCWDHIWHLAPEDCDLTVTTDSSDFGWGIYVAGLLYKGTWDDATARLHINVKEFMTLMIFLQVYLPQLSPQPRSLLWYSDNTSALAYTRKEGGLKSLSLLKVARDVLHLCNQRRIRITSAFVPTEENILADAASRGLQVADWHLLPSTFHRLTLVFGLPEIDLFASQASAQVPRFLSWNIEDLAEGFDALSLPWCHRLAYLFPPLPLMGRVIEKLSKAQGYYLLVAPYWETQKWFPSLFLLHILEARRLPFHPRLVVDLQTGKPPPTLNHLRLVVWKILGGHTDSLTSPPMPLTSSPWDGGSQQATVMRQPGQPFQNSFRIDGYLSIPSL